MAEIIKSEQLYRLYYDICCRLGAPEEEAEVVANCLLRADLRGLYTQGSSVFPYLVELVEKGLMNFDVPFGVINDQVSMAVVNGGFGVGSVMATKSMNLAIEKAERSGIGAVWLQHGGDFMMASNHVLQAIDQGMMGIVMRNGSPLVAPFGGREKFFGTNPISFGVPSENKHPIVVDMASGSFHKGRLLWPPEISGRCRRGIWSTVTAITPMMPPVWLSIPVIASPIWMAASSPWGIKAMVGQCWLS